MSTRRAGPATSQSAQQQGEGISAILGVTNWVTMYDTADGHSVRLHPKGQDPRDSYRLSCDLKRSWETSAPGE